MMLGMMIFMPSICFARNRTADSLLINCMWDYYECNKDYISAVDKNLYIVYHFSTKRRNALLYLIPTMYSIARGEKDYVGETYSKLRYRSANDYEFYRQVTCGTIPHQRDVMPILFELATPNLYNVHLYRNRILSPFHRTNRFFYKYRVSRVGGYAVIHFRPRSSNTQLIKGEVNVDLFTGRILSLKCQGEFDMIDFKIDAIMDHRDLHSPLPDQCTTEATFKFLGNNINASITSFYNCQTTLPDSIINVDDSVLMKKLRPIPLGAEEKRIYEARQRQEEEVQGNDTIQKSSNRLKEMKDVAWDIIGDNLINSTHKQTENITLNVSPLLNPLYMGYSHSKGLSYKLDIGARYAWNTHRYLTLNPRFGYNFKGKQFYYTLPLRMTYNPKRNGYTEFSWGNGNRTSHGALGEAFQKVMGDTIGMPDFKDEYFQLINNVVAFDWLEIITGMVYHRRESSDKALMQQAGLADKFFSFAPSLTVRLSPWKKGPTLTANYERGIKGVLQSNLGYERWEFDAVYKHQKKSVRILNLRLGAGFYTQRSTDYFVDFTNFRDNNLPMGWEDDWTGQFQLLDSRWYNESDYYIRSHVSYDSPLLMLSWIPWVGRIVETERIYISALSIDHTRPYYELGYGFQNRYFSTGIFASFLNTRFQSFGCKFTIELFRRW
ncbi:MAG: DUF5686 family protein [Prevotella sp.]|nr:DUF5686 family protein [Prevotella sp.]